MRCPNCGQETEFDEILCKQCGEMLPDTIPPLWGPEPIDPMKPPSPSDRIPLIAWTRPGVRFWARMFDMALAIWTVSIGLLLALSDESLAAVDRAMGQVNDHVFGFFFILAWVFVEALLLSTLGTTPGKWLFRTRLIPPEGRKPDLSTAMARSFRVWILGLGMGLPIVHIVAMSMSYNKLKREGTTTWDRAGDWAVVHGVIGPFRVLIILAFLGISLVLFTIGSTETP